MDRIAKKAQWQKLNVSTKSIKVEKSTTLKKPSGLFFLLKLTVATTPAKLKRFLLHQSKRFSALKSYATRGIGQKMC